RHGPASVGAKPATAKTRVNRRRTASIITKPAPAGIPVARRRLKARRISAPVEGRGSGHTPVAAKTAPTWVPVRWRGLKAGRISPVLWRRRASVSAESAPAGIAGATRGLEASATEVAIAGRYPHSAVKRSGALKAAAARELAGKRIALRNKTRLAIAEPLASSGSPERQSSLHHSSPAQIVPRHCKVSTP